MHQSITEFADRLEDAAYAKIAADRDKTRVDGEAIDPYARLDFALHLRRVAEALRAIELNDSGEVVRHEIEQIRRCMR